MTALECTTSVLRAGVWRAVVVGGETEPSLEVRHLDQLVDGVSIVSGPDGWHVEVPIPAEAISDGIHTFTLLNQADGEKVANFTLVAGDVLEDDIVAEVALLRAELDLLKRAFRRHCVETM